MTNLQEIKENINKTLLCPESQEIFEVLIEEIESLKQQLDDIALHKNEIDFDA